MTVLTTYALRLPLSVKAEAERLSKADGTSLNQFVAIAVAEKIAKLNTAAFFEERISRARAAMQRGEPSALAALLARTGGEPPREGDELPPGWGSSDTTAPALATNEPTPRFDARPVPAKAARRSPAKAASPARRKA